MTPFAGVKSLSDETIGFLTRRASIEGSKAVLHKKIGIANATFYRAMRGEGVDYTTHALIGQYILDVKKKGEQCQQQGS